MKGWKNNFTRDDDRAQKVRFDKRALKFLREIKTWQLLIILLIFVMLTAIFLRLNNLGMVDRRAALIAADKTGDIAKVAEAAKDLQNFVSGHMNTYTGRVALQTLYDEAARQAIEASRPPDISTDVYQRATDECMPQLRNYGYRAWAACVADRVGASGVTDLEQNEQQPPSPDAFYVVFAPARWSLDPAGVSMLVCFLLILTIILRLVLLIVLRIILKTRYKTA